MHVFMVLGAGAGIACALILASMALGWTLGSWSVKRERKRNADR